MNTRELTGRQKEVLRFIENFLLTRGFPPTLREIAEGIGLGIKNIASVQKHLKSLEKKGYIKRIPRKTRGIELTSLKLSNLNIIPIIGKVQAGLPIPAFEDVEGTIAVDSLFVRNADGTIALRVKGESMKNAGILPGDVVVVKLNEQINDNDIVVAFVDGEVTIKRIKRKEDTIDLVPENPEFDVITIKSNEERLYILGKVVAVFRRIG
ncbi:MAG TPA: repressor LexA [candidate division WOR-3 bacterium]|uniref:LexA repressor n=1 Tax=candidate division WOR-3 bacterium TaxID=2052148 RepID=A0A7V0LTQ8_UNCW3|nr:MAG: LexA family transcriptional regulator [Candidatus Hydrothermae bacterium]HDL60072.1 repressor LexA [candidate division WOR-3 bacterium]